jgi:hypothetical protein
MEGLAEAARLRRVAIGLWLVLAGMLAQLHAACVAGVLGLARIEPASILLAFQASSLLPLALQMAGHWLCLSVPMAVRMGRRPHDSARDIVVKTRTGFRAFARGRPGGFPARYLVVATLILDVLGLLLLGWSGAARFKLLHMPAWLTDSDFVFLAPLLLVPLVFSPFLILLGRYIDRWDLVWLGRAFQALVALGILLIGIAWFVGDLGGGLPAWEWGLLAVLAVIKVAWALLGHAGKAQPGARGQPAAEDGGGPGSPSADEFAGDYVNDKDPDVKLRISAISCQFRDKDAGLIELPVVLKGNNLKLVTTGKQFLPGVEVARRFFGEPLILTVKDRALVSANGTRFVRARGAGGLRDAMPAAARRTKARAAEPNPELGMPFCHALAADGSVAVTGEADDDNGGRLLLWDPRTGRPVGASHSNFLRVESLALSPDGSRLAFRHGRSMRLMNPKTGKFLTPPVPIGNFPTWNWRDRVQQAAFSPDGGLIFCTYWGASGHGRAEVLDGQTGRVCQRIEERREHRWFANFVLLPDGRTCVALCGSPPQNSAGLPSCVMASLQWWNLTTGLLDRREVLPLGTYGGLALAADGETLALIEWQGKGDELSTHIQVRSAQTGAVTATLDCGSAYWLAFTDKCLLNFKGDDSGLVEEWDVERRALVRNVSVPALKNGRSWPAPVFSLRGNRVACRERTMVTVNKGPGAPECVERGTLKFLDLTTWKDVGADAAKGPPEPPP